VAVELLLSGIVFRSFPAWKVASRRENFAGRIPVGCRGVTFIASESIPHANRIGYSGGKTDSSLFESPDGSV
jgi:hypothetical protein